MTVRVDFRTFVANLSDEFLACRADGHGPWRATTATWDPKVKVYDRKRRCGNCGTGKSQILDQEGYIIKGGGYQYPEGYLATNVENLPPLGAQRAAYRLEIVHRQMSEPRRRPRRRAS